MDMKTKRLTRLVFLITMTVIIEMLGLPQPITGPLVNMMLIVTTLLIGSAGGALLGFITPLMAMLRGQLPPFLFPMVPFIIISNFILVTCFSYCRRYFSQCAQANPLRSLPDWIGLLSGAFFKYAWLFLSAKLLLPIFLGRELPAKFLAAMALPQLITAITGGIIAFMIYNLLRTRIHIHSESIE